MDHNSFADLFCFYAIIIFTSIIKTTFVILGKCGFLCGLISKDCKHLAFVKNLRKKHIDILVYW